MGKIKNPSSDIFNFHIFWTPHTHRYHLMWNFTRAWWFHLQSFRGPVLCHPPQLSECCRLPGIVPRGPPVAGPGRVGGMTSVLTLAQSGGYIYNSRYIYTDGSCRYIYTDGSSRETLWHYCSGVHRTVAVMSDTFIQLTPDTTHTFASNWTEVLERGCAHCAVLASLPQREPCVPHPRRGGGFHDQQPCVRPGWVAGGGGGNGGIKHNWVNSEACSGCWLPWGAGCRQDADISAEFAASQTLCPAPAVKARCIIPLENTVRRLVTRYLYTGAGGDLTLTGLLAVFTCPGRSSTPLPGLWIVRSRRPLCGCLSWQNETVFAEQQSAGCWRYSGSVVLRANTSLPCH